jgi:hypothetical protein
MSNADEIDKRIPYAQFEKRVDRVAQTPLDENDKSIRKKKRNRCGCQGGSDEQDKQ